MNKDNTIDGLKDEDALIDILKPDFIHEDERGKLTQLVREGYSQFNIITSKKDVLRGDHYHRENEEAFYIISGRIKLILSKDEKYEEYVFEEGDMFKVKPYVRHSFYYLEDTVLASMYDKGVEKEDGSKDIYS